MTAEQIIEALNGTCQSIEDVCIHGEHNDKAIFTVIDQGIAKCETCDWWVEVGEVDENGDCKGCSTADDEDNDE